MKHPVIKLGNGILNEYWIAGARAGYPSFREAVMRDIAWYESRGIPKPPELCEYVAEAFKAMADGEDPKKVFKVIKQKGRVAENIVRNVQIHNDMKRFMDGGMAQLTASAEVALLHDVTEDTAYSAFKRIRADLNRAEPAFNELIKMLDDHDCLTRDSESP